MARCSKYPIRRPQLCPSIKIDMFAYLDLLSTFIWKDFNLILLIVDFIANFVDTDTSVLNFLMDFTDPPSYNPI